MDMAGETFLPDLDDFRIPLRYLARLLAAGNEAPVRSALTRLLAVRAFRRSEQVEGRTDTSILEAAGLGEEDARSIHRLLALAHYHERFVVPTTHREETDVAPFIERGFVGFGEMGPSDRPHRRTSFHGGRTEVGS